MLIFYTGNELLSGIRFQRFGFPCSSSNMEEYNLRVFVMVTHSPAGALPLRVIITSDETSAYHGSAFIMGLREILFS